MNAGEKGDSSKRGRNVKLKIMLFYLSGFNLTNGRIVLPCEDQMQNLIFNSGVRATHFWLFFSDLTIRYIHGH